MLTCLLLQLYHIWSWKSIACSGNMDSLSKVPDSVFHEKKKKQQKNAFLIFPESGQSIYAGIYWSHFWMHCACVKDRNDADLLLEVLCACVKDMKQKKFLRNFREAASRIDRNHGAICEKVLCTMESMAKSIDCTPAKPSPAKRRCFQTFKKVHHEKWSSHLQERWHLRELWSSQ